VASASEIAPSVLEGDVPLQVVATLAFPSDFQYWPMPAGYLPFRVQPLQQRLQPLMDEHF